MRFVIVGYGRVGSRTATILAEEGHDVVVVDNDLDRLERVSDDEIGTVHGDGSDEDVLAEAGIETADAIGAFTPDLNANFAACMVGTHHGCRTVLRIDADYREDIYEKYASDVDEVVYPERLGAIGAKNAMLGGNIRGLTRTITTAITLETSQGNFSVAFALGLILLTLVLVINLLIQTAGGRRQMV